MRGRYPYQRSAGIRNQARSKIKSLMSKMKCCICGYDKHVEVCHIKPIAAFPPDSLLTDVNALSNLTLLCPNHHWEFDRGMRKRVKSVASLGL